ncbi:transglycosylase family protein [Kitasatospora sp. NPDC048194]|uniref:transglycosylase family protein n=1 Tax=Kitasatospora sp. NPDC048194 TaxID=3364045 RepID=UPI0037198109
MRVAEGVRVAAGVRAAAEGTRVADLVWDELAECESGGDWRADTGNGFYGGLQIRLSTWAEAGGLHFADRPDHASRRDQTTVGEEILRQQGWEAWPSCARELGLIGGGAGGGGGGARAARGEEGRRVLGRRCVGASGRREVGA